MLKTIAITIVVLSSALSTCAGADDGPGTPPPFPDAQVRSWQVGLLRPDRLQHASFGLTAGAMIGLPSRSPEAAMAGTAALGVAKELWDARTSKFGVVDLLATCLGGVAAAAATRTLRD